MGLKRKIKKFIILKSIIKRNKKSPFNENYAESFQLSRTASDNETNSYYFSGHNLDTSSIIVRVAYRGVSFVEVWFIYKDTENNVYYNKIQKYSIKDNPISIKCIEISKKWEVTYKGELVLLSNNENKINVNAKLTFISTSKIFDFEHDLNPNILATSLSKEVWDERFRENNKINKQTHYEQQGEITLEIEIDNNKIKKEYLSMRDHSFGYRDWGYMDKHIWLMILINENESLNLNMVNYPHMKLVSGYYEKNHKTLGIIDSTKFSLLDGGGGCLNNFDYFIQLEDKTIINVKANLESEVRCDFDNKYTICEGIGTFIIGDKFARGIIEYGYNQDKSKVVIMKIINLDNIEDNDLDKVGGKAKGLYLLNKYGYNVPSGFVIVDCDIEKDKEEIIKYYNDNHYSKVAVRSSATLEDGLGFSSAGQYETYLNVSGEEELITCISLCIESCNQERIIAYRKAFNQENSKMNVIVMQMIDSKKAGVIFSIDPQTKTDTVLIEVVDGLGENLVSGISEAKEYLIDKTNPIIKEDSFLSKKIISELFYTTLEVEEKYNCPVDIEWATDNDNNVFFLQLRPITTLNDPTIDELNTKYQVDNDVITNHNVGEMLPGAITPLTISTVVYSIDFGLRKMLTKIGLFKKLSQSPSEFLVSHYYGHLFFNMKYLYRISKSVLGASKEAVDMGLCGRELEIEQVDNYKSRNIIVKAFHGIKYAKYMNSYKKALKDVVSVEDKINFDYSSINSLYNSITDNIIYLNQVLEDHYIVSSHSGAMSSAVFMFLNSNIKDKDLAKSKVAYVLEDIEGIESVDILKSMRDICISMLLEYPDCLDYNTEQLEYVLNTKDSKTNEYYLKFLQKHGHRCIKESELRNPGWKDDIPNLLEYLKSILPTVSSIKEKTTTHIDLKIDEVTNEYKGIKKKILKYLISQARLGCKNREYSKSKMILIVDKFKQAYKELSNKLVENSILPNNDLIYFLTHQELDTLINKHDYTLIRTSMVRKNLYKEQENLEFNHVNLGIPKPVERQTYNLSNGDIIQGTALSRGTSTGKARIVRTLEDARLLRQGEIMVASYTDIGWSPYFSLISGLITEVGSALSHGAVVAREYAIPLVSNVRFATDKIKTGDTILIDGTKGIVSIIESI